MKIWRLDDDGNSVGEAVELGGYELHAGPLRPDPDECVVASMRQAFLDITMEFKLSAKAFKRMAAMLWPSREAYLRSRHYWNMVRGNRPAPRRKNKPGRTGVRK